MTAARRLRMSWRVRMMYLAAALALVGGVFAINSNRGHADLTPHPNIGHVWVIQLENKNADQTWGANSPAPYLSQTLRSQGVLMTDYYGIGHNSLDNYIAQVSGQAPNADTQADCQTYSNFTQVGGTTSGSGSAQVSGSTQVQAGGIGVSGQASAGASASGSASTGTAPYGQVVGQGCVYPASVQTLSGQLSKSGRSWKGYMEDMGTPCRHPAIGTLDPTQRATATNMYAVRHNPFMYFHEIIDSPSCQTQVVDLNNLQADLKSKDSTPNFSYITPNLCNDGHDAPCANSLPGGLISADMWLQNWVPMILDSPAFKQDGLLIITFDESGGPQSDSSACCGEGPGPNSPLPGITGLGGGKVGALAISPTAIQPNTWSTTPYNHYSLLASIEDLFGLPYLGYAGAPNLPRFGTDVYNLDRG